MVGWATCPYFVFWATTYFSRFSAWDGDHEDCFSTRIRALGDNVAIGPQAAAREMPGVLSGPDGTRLHGFICHGDLPGVSLHYFEPGWDLEGARPGP